ncbi:MAG: Ig-like domain repeat protein [Solirubrobacteraceae bacterium]
MIETAGDSTGTTTATTNLIGQILPISTQAPMITGTAQQGQTLSYTGGTWSSTNGTTISDAWLECSATCTAISGQTGPTMVIPTTVPVGDTIEIQVTASIGASSTSVVSAPTAAVTPPTPVGPATIAAPTGITWQGQVLTAQTGTWTNSPSSYTYQWEECTTTCTAISGQTSMTMTTPTTVPSGDTIEVEVAGVNGGGTGTAVTSAPTAAITAPLIEESAPYITGTVQAGQTLTENNASWSLGTVTRAYQWYSCSGSPFTCTAIAGATAQTYPIPNPTPTTLVGAYIEVVETASSGGGSVAADSPALPVPGPVPVESAAPTLSGPSAEGQTLDASQGSWTNNPSSFVYQWMRCDGASCAAVPGATGPTYTLSGNDVGDQMYVEVTAGNTGGYGATVNSARSPVVMGSSTVSLAVTPGTPVTDQGVTLIATITSGAAIAPTTGSITFNNGNAAITGCSNVAVPARQTAIITCEASFGASTAQLSANFVPVKGSLLLGSSSSSSLAVGQASTKLSLLVGAVHLGSNTTFTATVDPPANSTGTILPTGRAEFFDKGVPIAKCHNQLVTRGVAKCQVRYTRLRKHHIMAKYSGDSNFSPSHSPTQLVKVGAIPPSGAVGALMTWKFAFHPSYTTILALAITGLSPGVAVEINCLGSGCPFNHSTAKPKITKCGKKSKRTCSTGSANLAPRFGGRHLRVGTQITVTFVHPDWIGKYYRFMIRPGRAPKYKVSCLAVNSSLPGVGC